MRPRLAASLTRVVTLAVLAALIGLCRPETARAEPLVADLSDHLIAITTGFTGAELLLFGSIERNGQVIVVVHGPRTDVTVRRKDRIAGVWVNTEEMVLSGSPAFYHVAMTEGATERLPAPVLSRHEIGPENVRVEPPADAAPEDIARFRAALIRNKQNQGLYASAPGQIEMRGERLFRTNVTFPVNVPIGTYVIETLLVHNGEVVSAQTTPLFVSKIGAGAEVFRLANEYPALHGLAAIAIAVFAGLGANWVFRKLGSA
ncbi:MAG: TIGR02186 family protein [Alphaproteobacteria bacterium]|nr:TIGR02186 family protein [Alphaproteobacteria bacterium]